MNEQLAKSLAEVVDLTKEGVVNGLSIIQVQAPELCEQILAYGFWVNLMGVLFLLVILPIFCIFFYRGVKLEWEKDSIVVWTAMSGLLSFAFTIMAVSQFIPSLIQIIVAPKLYLIEYLSRLIS